MKYLLLNLINASLFITTKVINWGMIPFKILLNKCNIKKLLRNIHLEEIDSNSIQDQRYKTDIIYNLVAKDLGYINFPPSLSPYITGLLKVKYSFAEVEIINLFGSMNGKSAPARNLESFAYSRLEVINLEKERFYFRPIFFATPEDFKRNIEVLERRFDPEDMHLYEFKWNKRFFLSVPDKAHTVAALYRQAKEQNLNYKIKGFLKSCEINPCVLDILKKEWLCYIISDQMSNNITVLNLVCCLREIVECYICTPVNGAMCIYLFVKNGSPYSKLIAQEFKNLEEQHKLISFYNLLG